MYTEIKEVEVGSVLIVNKQGNYLLVKAISGAGKGLWNNPGGRRGLEGQTESIEECAARESAEESGITPVTLGKHLVTTYFSPMDTLLIRKLVFLVTEYEGEPLPQEGEIEEVKWFSADEIIAGGKQFTLGVQLAVKHHLAEEFGKVYRCDSIA
jgi:8-oxo-dGTP pyrophosphatase MutT (NUDIX family)